MFSATPIFDSPKVGPQKTYTMEPQRLRNTTVTSAAHTDREQHQTAAQRLDLPSLLCLAHPTGSREGVGHQPNVFPSSGPFVFCQTQVSTMHPSSLSPWGAPGGACGATRPHHPPPPLVSVVVTGTPGPGSSPWPLALQQQHLLLHRTGKTSEPQCTSGSGGGAAGVEGGRGGPPRSRGPSQALSILPPPQGMKMGQPQTSPKYQPVSEAIRNFSSQTCF